MTLSLSAVIATHPVMLSDEIEYAGLTTAPLPISTSTWPLADGLLVLAIALMGVPDSTRRRTIAVAVLALGLAAAASTGCGGSTSNRVAVASSQQLTAVVITAGGAPATVEGLPAKLGTITVL